MVNYGHALPERTTICNATTTKSRLQTRRVTLACVLHSDCPGMLSTNFLEGEIEMRVFTVTVAGALVLFAVTAAFGMSVKSDYEKNFDFTQLHTFAFKTDRASNDPLSRNTLEAGRIQTALTAQLEANGFTQASQNPDFIVAFYSRTKEKTQVQSAGFGPGFGFGRGFGWGYGIPGRGRWRWGYGPDIWTTNYTQGCVMADI